MQVRNLIWANGNLSDEAFEAGLQSLPIAYPVYVQVSAEHPLHITGLNGFVERGVEANGIGAWIDGDTVYFDPVFVSYSEDTAKWLCEVAEQQCYFTATEVLHTEECDTLRLLFTLLQVSRQYGGATALRRGDDRWVVFAYKGECVYP